MPRQRIKAAMVGAVAGALLATGGAVIAFGALGDGGGKDCGGATPPVRVAVAPALAYVTTSALQAAAADGDYCLRHAVVVSSDPAAVVAAARNGGEHPDVWIPDSSVWLDELGDAAPGAADPKRLASSPLVLAVPAAVGASLAKDRPLDVSSLLPAGKRTEPPVQWVLPRPDRSAATVGAMLVLRSAVEARPDANTVVSGVLRGSSQETVSTDESTRPDQRLATPMSEQQVYAHNLDHPQSPLVAAYPSADRFVFDYPVAVLAQDAERREAAARLIDVLLDQRTAGLLRAAGFRSADGEPATEQASPVSRALRQVPTPEEADAARKAYQDVLRPSRLLAVIDVSGSMGRKVPGLGSLTRLNLASQAAINGLAVYPDDTAVGLWVFATDLTAKTDYRELAPIAPLRRGADGISGRERLATALAKVEVTRKGTGLYDSVLAAVREVRRTWDPERANSVVLITDGHNADRHGISLDKLVSTLRQENDPERPVAIYPIAYGPSSDFATLQQIAAAAGGKAYAAPDPRMISRVLRDAIGRRACTEGC